MWGVVQSQVYKELRRMKELGRVEMEREEQESRPDRKVYSITNAIAPKVIGNVVE
jgi:PadR family transcriptional regulator, regulatory protein AphA